MDQQNILRAVQLLKENHEVNKQTAQELGGCDHSVGICQCELNHMNEQTAAFLESVR